MISEMVDDTNKEIKMDILKIKEVYKTYNGKQVLSNVSLNINAGETFGLIGPSGVGKTTLIKLILGQTQADKGEIFVFGNDIKRFPPNY